METDLCCFMTLPPGMVTISDYQEGSGVLELCVETYRRFFLTLAPGAAGSPKGLSKKMIQSREIFI
jgi:hypothetical protein